MRWHAKFLRPRPARHQERIVIFHSGRCGSTVLERLLKQHPDIWPDSEIYARAFDHARLDNPQQTAAAHTLGQFKAALAHHPERRIYAFEVKFLPGLDLAHFDDDLPAYLELLRQNGVTRAVVLRRRNTLRRLVSTAIAAKTGHWHQPTKSENAPAPVRLDIRQVRLGKTMDLLAMLEHVEACYSDLVTRLQKSFPGHLDLIYEDHIEKDPLEAYRKFLEFAGVPAAPAQITLSRTQTSPLSESLSNFDEVATCLGGTRHEWMLDQL